MKKAKYYFFLNINVYFSCNAKRKKYVTILFFYLKILNKKEENIILQVRLIECINVCYKDNRQLGQPQ